MKHKKILIICSIILSITIILLSIGLFNTKKNTKNFGLLLGNGSEYINFNSPYDDSFAYDYNTSDFLYKMLEMDASKKNNNENIIKLSQLIKKANYVIINIGTHDIKSKIITNKYNQTLNYDLEILNRYSEVLVSNVTNIILKIKEYNSKINIYLLSLIYPYNIYDDKIANLFITINKSYELLANKYQINYLKIS